MHMNILIIDDEPLILNTVRMQLQEMKLPFQEIDTAGSAEEARSLALKKTYDIFLCDIVMPEEDGISFARWALDRFPDSKFVFLTAHADFEYMKEAISMQSFDYVLQPVAKEELQTVIERAVHQISIENKNRRLMEKGSFYQNHEQDILEANSYRYLSGLSMDDSFLQELLSDCFGSFHEDYRYLVYYLQLLTESPLKSADDKALFRSIYKNVADETLQPLGLENALIVRDNGSGDYLGILCFPEENEPAFPLVLQRLEELRMFFGKLLQLQAAVYCGRYEDYDDLPASVQEILEETRNNVRGASHVYQVGDLSSLSSSGYSFEQESATWKSLLQKNRLMDFKDSVFRYLDYHAGREAVNRDFLMRFHQRVSELILGYMATEDISSTDIFDDTFSYYDFMYCYDTVSHLKEGFSRVFQKLYEKIDIPGEELIQKTVRYIRSNIDRELLVTEIADYVALSPVYLTRAFKKATGSSLKRFIENEKIEAAKHLLTMTDLPVSVISGHVGYANYSNFTRSFKLLTGYTPSEYRNIPADKA